MSKCDKCLYARFFVSENGIINSCTLPQGDALNCMFGYIDKSVLKVESEVEE